MTRDLVLARIRVGAYVSDGVSITVEAAISWLYILVEVGIAGIMVDEVLRYNPKDFVAAEYGDTRDPGDSVTWLETLNIWFSIDDSTVLLELWPPSIVDSAICARFAEGVSVTCDTSRLDVETMFVLSTNSEAELDRIIDCDVVDMIKLDNASVLIGPLVEIDAFEDIM